MTQKITIQEACKQDMSNHAEAVFPEECCGAMLGRDDTSGKRVVTKILRVENTKDANRERRFLIEPKALLQAERTARAEGLDVVGIYHSHPNHPSKPSDFDRDHAMPFWSYLIVSCMQGKTASVQSYRLLEDRSAFSEESIEYIK